MCRLQGAMFACLMLMLSGCANEPSMLPPISQDLMTQPCKPSNAGANSDEDLQADIETAECVRELRLNIYRWQSWYRSAR